ncbi:MAG TPA: NAD(P)H-hydrate epimerase, partial [Erythrobacter sp.]|nr:NAD(P)H-hydrate epimerase [Erythrobacter sp.]
MSEPVLTVEQMRAAERAAVDAGTSEWELMQRAGRGAALWVMRAAAGRGVTVLCGPGNNGGDGYVIAQCLLGAGYAVEVIAPREPSSTAARTALAHYEGPVSEAARLQHPVVVDCLFGYGLSRAVEGAFVELLEELEANDCYRIAIDVPSAVESDSGRVLGPLPRYDLTLALGAWKQAHALMPAVARMGALRRVPIGIETGGGTAAFAAPPRLGAPAADAHKYRRGLLAIVAGAMPGAPLLSSEAAM